jgi:hypothetical protein
MLSDLKRVLSPKGIALMRAYRKEAKRRGMRFTDLLDAVTPEEELELARKAFGGPNMERSGLVPSAELVGKTSSGVPAIEAAVEAAQRGEWEPAAEVLAESYGDWDLRARAVMSLADVAAGDDTWLTAWRDARPEERDIAVVDGEALMMLAWQLRGTARAQNTTAEQFGGFHRVLPRAEEVAEQAAKALPDDPTPWFSLVTIGRGLSYDHERFGRVWQGVVDRAPMHRAAHVSALQYWCAKWRGSHERMFAFAEEAIEKSPSLSGLMVQAAYEFDDPKVWRQSNVQDAIEVLLAWLAGEGSNSLHVRDDLGWAAMALVDSGRAAEAFPLFQRLGNYAGGAPWRYWDNSVLVFDQYRAKVVKAMR